MVATTVTDLLSALGPLVPQIATGSGLGFGAGFLLKKAIKWIAYVVGFFIFLVAAITYGMQSEGWVTVTVHWDAINASIQTWLTSAISSLGMVLASVTAFSRSAALMFLAGFKAG